MVALFSNAACLFRSAHLLGTSEYYRIVEHKVKYKCILTNHLEDVIRITHIYISKGRGGLFWLILVLFLVKNGKMSSVARVSKEEKERNIICQHARLP